MNNICSTLAPAIKQYVDFDPTNSEHLKAFALLCGDLHHSKQHSTLRFNIQDPFQDVRSMMFYRVSQHYLSIAA